MGFALLAVTVRDLAGFAAIPRSVGLEQWHLDATQRAYGALPVATLGLGLPLAAGVAGGRRRLVLLMSSILIPLGTLLLLTPLLYISGLVIAWWRGADPVDRFGLKQGIVTLGAWKALVYPILYLWMGVKGVAWAQAPKPLPPLSE
jgi:hypothetical protein